MITNIKRNIVFIALALLAWFGYGDLDQEKSKATASAKSALRPIELADITAREPPADWVLTRDPYGLVIAVEKIEPAASASPRTTGTPSRAPAGLATAVSVGTGGQGGAAAGTSAAPVTSATPTGAGSEAGAGAAAPTGLHAAVPSLARWAEHAEALLASLTATSQAPPPELAATPAPAPELPPVQFTLQLQSTLAQAGGGQARISGQTVEVGAALVGFDPHSPPVLRAVEGSVATVTHRGKDYVLDLDHQAVISVGTPGVAAAAPPRTSGGMGGGGMGGGSANARSRSTAAPKPAASATASPATAPAPGAPKKATYKARSYPGKPKS